MRRIAVFVVMVLSTTLGVVANAHAQTATATDPSGDVTDAKGDLTSVSGAYAGGSNPNITFMAKTAAANAPTSDNWKLGDSELDWLIDVGGDGTTDFVAAFFTGESGFPEGHVYFGNSDIEVSCPGGVNVAFATDTYTITFPASCIGSPLGFRYTTELAYDTDANPDTPGTDDFAPNSPVLVGPVLPGEPTTGGYNILTRPGGIYSFGTASYHHNLIDSNYPGPAVGLAETPNGGGYVILTSFGGIYTFGNAQYFGNLIDNHYPGEAVAVTMTPTGQGYAILTKSGALYTFGDAAYLGNLIDHGYPGPAVSISYTPTGKGYAIATASGALYTFGDAPYLGNLLDHHYPGPAVSLAYTRSARGYYIMNDAGGLYTFGDAPYLHNLLDKGYPGPAVALSVTP